MVMQLKMTNSNDPIFVDNEDHEWAKYYNWCLSGKDENRYAITKENGKTKYLHVMIGERMGIVGRVDHIDTFPWNNLRENLRAATQSQNLANSRKYKRNSSSDYKGVRWRKDVRKWQAYIHIHGEQIHLEHFDIEEHAAKAYDRAAIFYHGEFARTNFPKSNYD